MTNAQIYIEFLKQIWWLFALVIILIGATAYTERVQAKGMKNEI